jgi:hypothetical protein
MAAITRTKAYPSIGDRAIGLVKVIAWMVLLIAILVAIPVSAVMAALHFAP